MIKIIYILSFILLVSACEQPNSKPENKSIITPSPAKVDSVKPISKIENPATLDSIDKENNESVIASADNITKASVFLKGDSTIHLTANIRQDHRIFGYENPDIKSERLFLLSVFTNDIKNNPFGCKLGAYYQTSNMDDITLKYISTTGDFIKAEAIDKTNKSTTIYFEKKWVEFE
jgi:hypothetical protein